MFVPAGWAQRLARYEWGRVASFSLIHVACIGVLWVGTSPIALWTMVALYVIRMFSITGFYHRYFSHRSFRTSRAVQFIFAVLGTSAVQCGPIWWAAHHRVHHTHSDTPPDVHSPLQWGFFQSHVGWFLMRAHFTPNYLVVKDLMKFPELRFLDRFDVLVPSLLATVLFSVGMLLKHHAPSLGTDGWQMLVWGFFVSTVAVYHATYAINSLSHVFGRQRYGTGDSSRNSILLALLTLGEGWHNNHHHYPSSVRQGFYWWELDLTFYALRMMSWMGLVWDMKPIPASIRDRIRVR